MGDGPQARARGLRARPVVNGDARPGETCLAWRSVGSGRARRYCRRHNARLLEWEDEEDDGDYVRPGDPSAAGRTSASVETSRSQIGANTRTLTSAFAT